MANYANIQFLFSQIAAAQLIDYLKSRGWKQIPHDNPDLTSFARSFASHDAPVELTFFSSEAHPRFRHKIPDVIFRLCLMEERPALDIANEIYDIGRVLAEPAFLGGKSEASGATESPRVAAGVTRWTLQHGRAERLTVHVKARDEAYSLDPGDRLTLVYRPDDAASPEVVFNDLELIVQIPAGTPLRMIQTAPADLPTLRDVIRRELSTLRHRDGNLFTEESVAGLADLLRRIAFELGPCDEADPQRADSYRKQAAVLAVTLARSLPATRMGRLALWRCILRLCACGQLGFELYATAAEDLALIASGDDPVAPVNTLDWLKSHAFDRTTATF